MFSHDGCDLHTQKEPSIDEKGQECTFQDLFFELGLLGLLRLIPRALATVRLGMK